jgi:hypothetical protein
MAAKPIVSIHTTIARLGAGITYYLLKMTDVDGSVSYSKVVAVVNQADGFVITSLSPNPATSVAKAFHQQCQNVARKFCYLQYQWGNYKTLELGNS